MRWIPTKSAPSSSSGRRPSMLPQLTLYPTQLFKLSENLFPPPDVPVTRKGFSLPNVTRFPFQIQLPTLSACSNSNDWIKHYNTTLPPSINILAPNNSASGEVKYCLKVKVQRPGRFKPDVTILQDIKFLPLDPGLPPPM